MSRSMLLAGAVIAFACAVVAPAHADESTPETPAPERGAEPTASSAAHPPATPSRRPETPPVVGMRFHGGYGLRELFALPLQGGAAGVAIDLRRMRWAAFWGEVDLFLGATENGLRVRSLAASAGADLVLDRFRIGGGLGGMWIGVERVTRDRVIPSWGPFALVAARLDIVRSDSFAIFARAALDGGLELRSGALTGGATFGAGFDIDVVGKRDAFR